MSWLSNATGVHINLKPLAPIIGGAVGSIIPGVGTALGAGLGTFLSGVGNHQGVGTSLAQGLGAGVGAGVLTGSGLPDWAKNLPGVSNVAELLQKYPQVAGALGVGGSGGSGSAGGGQSADMPTWMKALAVAQGANAALLGKQSSDYAKNALSTVQGQWDTSAPLRSAGLDGLLHAGDGVRAKLDAVPDHNQYEGKPPSIAPAALTGAFGGLGDLPAYQTPFGGRPAPFATGGSSGAGGTLQRIGQAYSAPPSWGAQPDLTPHPAPGAAPSASSASSAPSTALAPRPALAPAAPHPVPGAMPSAMPTAGNAGSGGEGPPVNFNGPGIGPNVGAFAAGAARDTGDGGTRYSDGTVIRTPTTGEGAFSEAPTLKGAGADYSAQFSDGTDLKDSPWFKNGNEPMAQWLAEHTSQAGPAGPDSALKRLDPAALAAIKQFHVDPTAKVDGSGGQNAFTTVGDYDLSTGLAKGATGPAYDTATYAQINAQRAKIGAPPLDPTTGFETGDPQQNAQWYANHNPMPGGTPGADLFAANGGVDPAQYVQPQAAPAPAPAPAPGAAPKPAAPGMLAEGFGLEDAPGAPPAPSAALGAALTGANTPAPSPFGSAPDSRGAGSPFLPPSGPPSGPASPAGSPALSAALTGANAPGSLMQPAGAARGGKPPWLLDETPDDAEAFR